MSPKHELVLLAGKIAIIFVCFIPAGIAASCKPPPASSAKDGAQLVACIAEQRAQGITDPVAIGIACAAPEGAAVVDIISTLDKHAARMSKCAPADGGAK